jgi:pyrroline-5-carboxylate reductase
MGLGQRHIGLVGGGNMAEALVRGLLEARVASTAQLRASDPDQGRRDHLMQRYGIATATDNAVLAAWADVLVIAVKPAVVATIAADVRDALRPETLVVSIAAGVPTSAIEGGLGKGARVVRAMPNTAAMATRRRWRSAPPRRWRPAATPRPRI